MSSEPVLLRDLIEVSPKTGIVKGQSYPFMDMAAITEWQRDVPLKSLTNRQFMGSGSKFQSGDILLARITPCFENGKTAVAPAMSTAGHGSTEFIVIRAKSPEDRAFIYALMRSEDFREHAIRSMVGSSGRQRIPNDALNTYSTVLPAQDYRARASKLLCSIEDLCSSLKVQNTALESVAQNLFRSWCVDFDPVHAKVAGNAPEAMSAELATLFPNEFGDSELGLIPKGWTVTSFGAAFDIKGGGTPSTKETSYWDNGTHSWATPKDMSNLASKVIYQTAFKLTTAGVNKISSKVLPAGTTLMSSRAPVGYLAIAKAPISINQGFIAVPPTDGLPPSFIVNLLLHKMSQIKANAGGTTFAEISKSQFRPIKWVRPSVEVLKAFGRIAEPLFAAVHANCLTIGALSKLRDHLLPRLISGKLRLEDAEASVEAITSGLEAEPA